MHRVVDEGRSPNGAQARDHGGRIRGAAAEAGAVGDALRQADRDARLAARRRRPNATAARYARFLLGEDTEVGRAGEPERVGFADVDLVGERERVEHRRTSW